MAEVVSEQGEGEWALEVVEEEAVPAEVAAEPAEWENLIKKYLGNFKFQRIFSRRRHEF